MKLTILSDDTFEFTPSMLMRIEEAAPRYELVYQPAATATDAHVAAAEILFGCPELPLLRQAPQLKWHHLPNAGIQPYTRPDLYLNSSIMLTNSRGVYGAIIAEHVVAMVYALARNFPLYIRQKQTQTWERDDFGSVWVAGSTVAVFGLGDLGAHSARLLKALGAHVIGVRRSLLQKPSYVDEVYDLRSAAAVLERADFVICCLPLTPQTQGLFSAELLSHMKQRSYFINVGRGAIVDTEALVGALATGYIAGAALDVTAPEPPPPGHPLWTLDNVLLTPHASCVCDDIQERKLTVFLQLLERYVAGRRLPNQVNFLQGY